MRILHVIQRFWPARGGAEQHLGEISARLAAMGHQVTVLTTDALDFELFWDPRRRRVPEGEGEWCGVRIIRFPVHHLPCPWLSYRALRRLLWLMSGIKPIPVDWMSSLAQLTPLVPELDGWLQACSEPYDLVAGMTICFESLLFPALQFARRRGIPFVLYPLTHLGAGKRPAHDAISRFYTMRHQVSVARASDGVVAQTPTEAAFFRQAGIPTARVMVAGPGVCPAQVLGGDARRFRDRHGLHGPLVAAIGSMTYDKGTVHLVQAMGRLWSEGSPARLVLAGAVMEPFRRFLERLSPETRGRVKVLGAIEEDDKRDLLAAADVVAMPSRSDSFGIVYLEAWLYSKPVIGARTWGVMDVIEDGRTGVLVPFGDVEALAAAVRALLTQPERRAAMGAAGRERVYRLHTWDRKVDAVHQLYTRLAVAEGCP